MVDELSDDRAMKARHSTSECMHPEAILGVPDQQAMSWRGGHERDTPS